MGEYEGFTDKQEIYINPIKNTVDFKNASHELSIREFSMS
jgi:hypothetical protein